MVMAVDEQISFDQWIAYVFDHPVTNRQWHFDMTSDYWDGPPADIVVYLTRTFEECETVFWPFSDAQVAQGLNFLISPSCSDFAFTLLETDVSLVDRLHCIDAMATLFERYFALRCSPHLSRLDVAATPEDVSPLNGICYMWWDVLPLHGLIKHRPEHPDAEVLDRAIMVVLRRILMLDSVACQESALFGLAFWTMYYPEIDEVIDEFIAHHGDLFERFRPEVRKTVFGEQ